MYKMNFMHVRLLHQITRLLRRINAYVNIPIVARASTVLNYTFAPPVNAHTHIILAKFYINSGYNFATVLR